MSEKPSKPEGQPPRPRYRAKDPKQKGQNSTKPAKKMKAAKAEVLSVDETLERQMAISNKADDYQLAIVASSLLEDMLKAAIKVRMIAMDDKIENSIFNFDNNGPLSSFSSKIRIAYALGVIDLTVRSEIDIIRSIRNHFAHNRNIVSFEDDGVREECERLSKMPALAFFPFVKQLPARNFFKTTCFRITLKLSGYIERSKLEVGNKEPPINLTLD